MLVLKNFDAYTPLQQMRFDYEQFWVQLHQLPMGNSLGKIIDIDISEDGVGWGRFLHLKVELCLTKVIVKGRTVKVQGKHVWISLRYEKLPKIYLNCGRIVHISSEFPNDGRNNSVREGDSSQFGSWLCAEPTQKKNLGRSFYMNEKNSSTEH